LLLHHDLLIDRQAQSHNIHVSLGIDFLLVAPFITHQPFFDYL
jgi:hypothetical protein